MKNPVSCFALAALVFLSACSEEPALSPNPPAPEKPSGGKVAPESIAFAVDEAELAADGRVTVDIVVTPADADVVPADFALVDDSTGEPVPDMALVPTGEDDEAAGTYGMRIVCKDAGWKFRRSVRAVYAAGELSSGPLMVRAAVYMPVVSITTSAPVVDKETWIASTVSIDGGNRFDDMPETELSVRGRGNSTWSWEKKPYALKFTKKQSVLGMPKHKRWCLIANYMDRTHMRNRLAYRIGAISRLAYTVRNEFAELYLNGEYMGCYLLTEQIKVDENRVNISETDGFLLEFDSYFDEDVRFRSSASNIPVNVKSPDPEDITDAQLAALKEYVNRADEAVQALRRGAAGDSPFEYIDRESMIDLWIIFELMANREILHPKSLYFHKDAGGKLVAGPIWDFDWGTLTDSRRTGWIIYGVGNSSLLWMDGSGNNWWNVLLTYDASFRAAVKERWTEWYPSLQGMAEFIRSEKALIASAVARDNVRWPDIKTGNVNGDLTLPFGDAVERLASVYTERAAWIDREIAKW